jgi:hypothetical protein
MTYEGQLGDRAEPTDPAALVIHRGARGGRGEGPRAVAPLDLQVDGPHRSIISPNERRQRLERLNGERGAE